MSDTKYCTHCGTLNAVDAKFCQSCGKPFTDAPQTPPVEPEQSQKKKSSNRTTLFLIIGGLILICFVAFAVNSVEKSGNKQTNKTEPTKAQAVAATPTPTATNTPTIEPTATEIKPTSTPRPTRTPGPTKTPAPPTDTPEPTNTPEPLSPEQALSAAIITALGDSNRDVERVPEVGLEDGYLYVTFAINDNLTEGMIKHGAQMDVVDILESVAASDVEYEQLDIIGTFPLVDAFGNVEETDVIGLLYNSQTVGKINFDNFSTDNAYVIADSARIHPTFQE